MASTLFVTGLGGTIDSLHFDPNAASTSQRLVRKNSFKSDAAPSWLTLHNNGKILYTGDELAEPAGTMFAYFVSNEGELKLVSEKKISGQGPVSFVVSQDSKFLYCANYASGSLSKLALKPDGTFTEETRDDEESEFVGAGIVTDRQEASHLHQATLDPTGKFLLVPDLGSDSIRIFSTQGENGLSVQDQKACTPGTGPRHLVFGKRKRDETEIDLVYLVNELSNSISIFEIEYPTNPEIHHLTLKTLQENISILPEDQSTAGWLAGEISLSPSQNFLIVSNRAADEPLPKDESDLFTIFRLDSNGLVPVGADPPQFYAVGGRGLRHFSICPKGKFLAVACQKTNELIILRIEDEREELQFGHTARLNGFDQPTCVIWRD